jgi:hypothetical protein
MPATIDTTQKKRSTKKVEIELDQPKEYNVIKNIAKGAIQVSDSLVIGGKAESCLLCGSYLTGKGCSNLNCIDFREESWIQVGLRKLCLLEPNKLRGLINHG